MFNKFIRDYGEIEVECIGARYNRGEGKGLEIPVDYKLTGNLKYLEKLVSRLKLHAALTFRMRGNSRPKRLYVLHGLLGKYHPVSGAFADCG